MFNIKQVIRIYVPSGRPNGWTEWADIFGGALWVAVTYAKKFKFYFFKIFKIKKIYIHVERRALQPVFNKILANSFYYRLLLWKRARIQKPSLSICAHF